MQTLKNITTPQQSASFLSSFRPGHDFESSGAGCFQSIPAKSTTATDWRPTKSTAAQGTCGKSVQFQPGKRVIVMWENRNIEKLNCDRSFQKIAKLSWRYHMICNQEAYTAMMFRNSTMLLAWQPGPAGLLYQVLPVGSGVHSVLISSRSLSSQNDLGRKHQKETQATKPAWHKFHHLARHTEQKLQL